MNRTRRSSDSGLFLVLLAGVWAYSLLQSVIVPVLPELQRALETDQKNVTWILTANLLAASVFTPIMGRVGDRVGKKKIFLLSLALLVLGSLVSGLADNLTMMLVGRVIQGMGGGIVPLAFGIVREQFPPERIAGAIGRLASMGAAGLGIGIVSGGPIATGLSYRWLFFLPMIVLAASYVAAHRLVRESEQLSGLEISWLPAVLLSAWLVALLLTLSEGSTWGWTSAKSIGLVLLAVVLAAAWMRWELRAATPFIDMRMMRLRPVWTTNLVSLLFGVGIYSAFAFVTTFAQTPTESGYGFGVSTAIAGLLVLPAPITSFAFGQLTGPIVRLIGGKGAVLLACLMSGSGLSILTFAHSEPWQLLPAMALLGAGFGLAFAAMSGLIVLAVAPDHAGVASGMNANIRTIGGAIGAAMMSAIITGRLQPNGLPYESGYTAAFAMLLGTMVLGGLAALAIPSRSTSPNVAAATADRCPE